MAGSNSPSVIRHIPNCITTIGLISGLVATVFAFNSFEIYGGMPGYKWCWVFICIALVCDFCDGFSARILGAYSDLGKNLDSLSDLVSFGIAPCFLTLQMLQTLHPHWSFVIWLPLLIPVTGAYRLAKFNIDASQKTVFSGLPIPANAIFWIGFSHYLPISGEIPAWIVTFAIIVIAFLMVTPIPMFSLKVENVSWNTANCMRLILLASAVLFVIFLGMAGFMWTILLYIALSVYSFYWINK